MYDRDNDWKRYGYKVRDLQNEVSRLSLDSVFSANTKLRPHYFDEYYAGLSVSDITHILSIDALGPPHGRDLLVSPEMPKFPQIPKTPTVPDKYQEAKGYQVQLDKINEAIEKKRDEFQAIIDKDKASIVYLHLDYERPNPKAVEILTLFTLCRHPLPKSLLRPATVTYDEQSRVLLCEIEVPDFRTLPIVKKRAGSYKWVPASAAEKKKLTETLLYSLCIRAAYLAAMSDYMNYFDLVALNARQHWADAATGTAREGIIASLQSSKADLIGLQPGLLEAKACFQHLRGISTPSIEVVSPVRPIFILDKTDHRIVENRDVDAEMQADANLASMPWEDFEHLVRQLFEWEFAKNGVEIKVTRASRDRGVDALMFDPDPLRGGKYVLQAKRYTKTVDVSAVRDLYGTVMNEGANRGILVTTSTFGPDAYEFVKDKPLSLVDGPNLLVILQRHGRRFRIDLAEARRLEFEAKNTVSR